MALDTVNQSGLALEIKTLRKSYGEVDVLHDIDVQMAEGEFLVLVGPSGCGKSTLLNCIAGLEETTGGQLFIGGRDVIEEPPKDRDIAMVFQSYALYPTMTVAENIGFGMKIRRVPKEQAKAKVDEVAKMLQIEQLLNRQPSQLSGGQRQRVAMGRALVREPKLYLFDEPLSNLDAKLRVEMRAEIKKLHRTTGASIVYVTHDQIEAMTLASRIVVLKDGYVQQIGTPQEIYETPANTFVADFMGSPPMNLIPAQVTDAGVMLDGTPLQVSVPGNPAEVIVGLRPEHIVIDPASPFSVTPTLIENTGAECYVGFELNGKPVTARAPGRMDESRAEPIPVRFVTESLSFFDSESGVLLR